MANWTGPNPNRLLPGEPWSSDLALASFEDPVAIAEGAVGAPKVESEGLDLFVGGVGAATYIDLDRVDKVLISLASGTNCNLSTDNGATFGGNITIGPPGAVVSLGSSNNAIKVNGNHTIVGISGVKP